MDRLSVNSVIRTAARALCAATFIIAPAAHSATLESDQTESTEGYFQLRWEADEPVRLVEASAAEFTDAETIYTGSDSAHVVSGKPDASYFYRLESVDGERILTAPVEVLVRHHPLRRAFAFFGIGAVVFLATLVLVFFVRPEPDERA